MTGLKPKQFESGHNMRAEFLRRGVYGFAMGDAYGVPYEFSQTNIDNNNEMIGSDSQLAGSWSDDTSMVLASIMALTGMYDPKAMMQNFDDYLYQGAFTPNQRAFGYGEETEAAIKYFHDQGKFGDFGKDNPMGNGNGALMRVWPIAFYDFPSDQTLEQVVDEVTGLTHGQMRSKLVSRLFVYFIRLMPRMKNVDRALMQAIRAINRQPAVQSLLEQEELGNFVISDEQSVTDIVDQLRQQSRSNIVPSGYVIDTLNTVLWTVLNHEDYESAVIDVVSLGGDTDTNAALVGLVMSFIDEQLPEHWFDTLQAKNKIESVLILADESQKFD